MHYKTNQVRAYIRGAYGPGNLGDDVLLDVCINILKEHFNEENISVGVKSPKDVGYLKKYSCNYLPISAPIKTDFLFFGGGGQFFDFENKKNKKSPFQRLISARKQGISGLDILNLVTRKLLKKSRASYQKSAAMCLGLGPFEKTSSQEIKSKLTPYLNCDYKSVRDETSLEIANSFSKNSRLYTDPTFLFSHWCSYKEPPNRIQDGSIGVILRKWDLNQHGKSSITNTINAAKKLVSLNHKITFISLYQEYDREIIDQLKEFDWMIWDPLKDSPDSFIAKIQQSFDILISTRAHGVLLPAQVGVPSVVVGIEPKLKNIHKLLPNGTIYCDGTKSSDIVEATLTALDRRNQLSQLLKKDVERQSIIANRFLDDIGSWIKESLQELR